MLIERDPESWQDLQNLTAKIFAEMGCASEVEKEVETVRGVVEIDVYVEDPTHTPPLILLCECKYWSKPIPKHVVHAFRTVTSDCRANRGFVISKAGFQSGAIEAVENSNIVLVDWTEFQNIFYSRWVGSRTKSLFEYADIIFDFMDVLDERMEEVDWTEENKAIHLNLMHRSSIFIYANQWHSFGGRLSFPMTIANPNDVRCAPITLDGYKEFFDLAFSVAPPLLEEWRQFFGEDQK